MSAPFHRLAGLEDAPILEAMQAALDRDEEMRTKDFWKVWCEMIEALPDANELAHRGPLGLCADGRFAGGGKAELLSSDEREKLEACARRMHPWRKGPWRLFGLEIDAEWQSDIKWNRVAPHINLSGKRVADIGCGNGYYMLRMLEQKPAWVLGFEPMLRFRLQFEWAQHMLGLPQLQMLPAGIDDLEGFSGCFDVIFCMGVLYHRNDPWACLELLRESLAPGGMLVLETITLPPDDPREEFTPEDRYAAMNNVHHLCRPDVLVDWLSKAGYADIKVLDESKTTFQEQRRTEWMTFFSLQDFLDPDDTNRTIEGHPAPRRTLLLARK